MSLGQLLSGAYHHDTAGAGHGTAAAATTHRSSAASMDDDICSRVRGELERINNKRQNYGGGVKKFLRLPRNSSSLSLYFLVTAMPLTPANDLESCQLEHMLDMGLGSADACLAALRMYDGDFTSAVEQLLAAPPAPAPPKPRAARTMPLPTTVPKVRGPIWNPKRTQLFF